ncbi:MAG: glycogen/starch synthase [Candidatus Omnitrophota bacterium]|nr:glycogen/starch synthase [Candidatus Omnitrophota bacterium]
MHKKIINYFLIFIFFFCSASYAENLQLRVPIGDYLRIEETLRSEDASQSLSERRFKEAMGADFSGIRNFYIDEKAGRYVFQKELKSKKDARITYYYENSLPVELDGNIDDLLVLYNETLREDENSVETRYLVFKRLARYRESAFRVKLNLEWLLKNERSEKVLGEIQVAINMVSGNAVDGGKRLKTAYVFYELSPFVAKGGVKDVAKELPRTFRNKRGHEASVFMPYWQGIVDTAVKENNGGVKIEEVEEGSFELDGEKVQLYSIVAFNRLTGKFEPIDGVPIYLIKCDKYFSNIDKGDIYRQDLDRSMPAGSHLVHPENAMTAIFFSKAALEAMKVMKLKPDVISTADWQTAHVSTLLKKSKNPDAYRFFENTRTLHTIHNIGPKGLVSASPYAASASDAKRMWDFMGITDDAYQLPDQNGVEFHGNASLQKGGIVYADKVSTVSMSYATELKTRVFGSGFEGINAAFNVIGVPNGISLREWNSATSSSISHRFANSPSEKDRRLGVLDIREGKRENKKSMVMMINEIRRQKTELQEFTCDEDTPIFCFLGRFDDQKGLNVLLAVLENEQKIKGLLKGGRIKIIFAGTGNIQYMSRVKKLEKTYPGSVAYLGWVDETAVKKLFAGVDVNIMPSIFEPKGIVQMQAARFGVVNLVNKVGGLKDDITDFLEGENGNGYAVDFAQGEPVGLLRDAMIRAIGDFDGRDKVGWDTKVRRVLADSEKYGWDLSCLKYELLFNALTGNYADLFIPHRVDHFEMSDAAFANIMTEIGIGQLQSGIATNPARLASNASLTYGDYLLKGREIDSITKTVMLTGSDAKEFLVNTAQFYHETTVCNIGPSRLTVEIDGTSVELDDIGIVVIRPQSKVSFKEIPENIVVIVTQNPETVSNWYRPYNPENFPNLFADKRYNESGIISPFEWRLKGVTVIDYKARINQWTLQHEPEWLVDSMAFGSNLVGVSIVRSNIDTGDKWINFNQIRPQEAYHRHPNKPNGNFIEVYYIAEGMAALAFEEESSPRINILRAGGMLIAKDGVPHTILAAKGPYKHLAIQIPSTFQYGFEYKQNLTAPPVIQKISDSAYLNEILNQECEAACSI